MIAFNLIIILFEFEIYIFFHPDVYDPTGMPRDLASEQINYNSKLSFDPLHDQMCTTTLRVYLRSRNDNLTQFTHYYKIFSPLVKIKDKGRYQAFTSTTDYDMFVVPSGSRKALSCACRAVKSTYLGSDFSRLHVHGRYRGVASNIKAFKVEQFSLNKYNYINGINSRQFSSSSSSSFQALKSVIKELSGQDSFMGMWASWFQYKYKIQKSFSHIYNLSFPYFNAILLVSVSSPEDLIAWSGLPMEKLELDQLEELAR
jgi:hypothetical protein